MALTRLQINHVRNLRAVTLGPLDKVNLLHGANGSGKTSILEAIHVLGMARSFRGTSIKSLISHNEDSCTVFGVAKVSGGIAEKALGVQRLRSGGSQIKVGGQPVNSVAELVEHLPVQVINADSFDLLTGPPTARRQCLNWGVFHGEQRVYKEWQRCQRCIKQRNVLLRRGKIGAELKAWTRDLSSSGTQINLYRQQYMEKLVPKFEEIAETLLPYHKDSVELRYRQGWDKTQSYGEALEASLPSDLDQGYTHTGPQRADIKVMVDGYSAADTLSRGQQKLVVTGLKLAQGLVMNDLGGDTCTYLVDDLPSELDTEHCERVCCLLSGMNAQVFVTCVERSDIEARWPDDDKLAMFHVEHGQVSCDSEYQI